MKLIIDIPEEDYEYIRENKGMHYTSTTKICEAIFEGIPLPKGHGRLIDEKEATNLIAKGKKGKAYFGILGTDWEVIDFLKTVPTIIEADKGE